MPLAPLLRGLPAALRAVQDDLARRRARAPLAPGWLDVLLIVACALLVPLMLLRLSLGLSLLGAVAAGIALVVGTQLAFQAGWVTSFVYPLAALLLSAIGALAVAASASTPRM